MNKKSQVKLKVKKVLEKRSTLAEGENLVDF